MDEDRRKEPPNPREPIDDAVGKKEPAQHPANVANQSQQLATPPSISPPLAAQVSALSSLFCTKSVLKMLVEMFSVTLNSFLY